MDCSPPGSSVCGILQARILEWVAMPSSRGSSQPRDGTHVSCGSCIAGGFFITEPPGKPKDLTDIPKIFLQDTDPHQMKTADCKHIDPTLVETRRFMMLEI